MKKRTRAWLAFLLVGAALMLCAYQGRMDWLTLAVAAVGLGIPEIKEVMLAYFKGRNGGS